jgi:hypothetical protein
VRVESKGAEYVAKPYLSIYDGFVEINTYTREAELSRDTDSSLS